MGRICFTINGVPCSVGSEVSSDVTLLDYLRNCLELRGTKYMCRQAGCGACIVVTSKTPGTAPQAVNSCMVSITSCSDWEITTIEGLGNRKKGYHVIQKTLAKCNGSQCGHCSPGWVMSMYSLLQMKKDLTMLEIEKSFASNICRCTGYRPILEAFKSFAKDAPKSDILDIEDLEICEKTGRVCNKSCSEDEDWCVVSKNEVAENLAVLKLKDGRKWFQVNKVKDVFDILKAEGVGSYMLVAGNTAKGAYPILEYPRTLIDISGIQELKGFIYDQNMVIGSGNTLTELLGIFRSGFQRANFQYLKEFYQHLELVAHIAVRNLGTIGGNLMIKHQHNEFQSDLYLMFETVGAVLTIMNRHNYRHTVTMEQFLNTNMDGSVILNVKLPPLKEGCKVKTYKVMPRSQNAHAIVNFGALYDFNQKGDILQNCRLVFGGLAPTFSRAKATEKFILGKPLFRNETLQSAIKMLDHELVVVDIPPEPSPAYRKKLAIGLFYKSLLSLCPNSILKPIYKSGSVRLHESRPVSEAKQSFQTNPSLWPLNEPTPKLESLIQCAGEAIYSEDIPSFPHEVFAEIVLSTIGKGSLLSIDPSKALKYPGVIAFYTAKDIPGLNSFTPVDDKQYQINEEVLSSGEINYYNQPIAIVVAKTRHIAEVASEMVDVTYKNVVKPVINIKEAKKLPKRNEMYGSINAKDKGDQIVRIVKGSNTIYGQYHFTMETLAIVSRPTEEGLEVHATSQWPDALQTMVARALNMDANKIDVYVRRIGGGFGIKISRIILSAVACCLVTTKLNLPCRIIHSMEKIMRAFGKRFPCSSDYEFAVDNQGIFQFGNLTLYEDNGFTRNEMFEEFSMDVYSNCYSNSRWNYKLFASTTDTAKNTWFRAPGTLEAIAMVELIMEHIAFESSKDSLQLRLANLDPEYASDIKTMLNAIMPECQYEERKANVKVFNARNRWKKRGLKCVPIRWGHTYSRYFDVNLAVYHVDGTVTITHGGVEIGQGINTRTAQICAYFLKIPLNKIQVKANSTINTPNSAVTGGSLTCQHVGIGMERCCKELIKRLEPVKAKLGNPSWPELIAQAYKDSVDLQVHGFVGDNDVYKYNVYGVACAEVEIDVLTGELEVLRVDVMSDAGQSVSPALDIGQVEGAIIMGLGYWTCEQLVYDQRTGELLTDRPWNYYVPQARDIPLDLRVYLRKNSYSLPAVLGSKGSSDYGDFARLQTPSFSVVKHNAESRPSWLLLFLFIGEPPMCMAVVFPLAIKEAVISSRFDSGKKTWYPNDGPSTAENICMSTCTRLEEYLFY